MQVFTIQMILLILLRTPSWIRCFVIRAQFLHVLFLQCKPDISHNFTFTGRCYARMMHLLVSIRTFPLSFVIFGTVVVCTVVECSIFPPYRSSSSLIIKVPIETYEWFMLIALMLQE